MKRRTWKPNARLFIAFHRHMAYTIHSAQDVDVCAEVFAPRAVESTTSAAAVARVVLVPFIRGHLS